MRIAAVVMLAAAVWWRVWEPFPQISILGALGTVYGGWPIFYEAWTNLLQRRMTMELSMTIALLAAVVVGEFFTALVITAFVLGAEVLEGLTAERGRRAIRNLLDLLPRTATVRRAAGSVRVALSVVRRGDVVLVSPGERIPVDGEVRGGDSVRRSVDDHRRVDAGGEDCGFDRVCRHHQPVRCARDRRRRDSVAIPLRQDHRRRRTGGTLAGTGPENGGSVRGLSRLLRPGVCRVDLHADAPRLRRRSR